MKTLLTALLVAALAAFAVSAFAQSCTTYYDHNTGKFCRVCTGSGSNVGSVVCY